MDVSNSTDPANSGDNSHAVDSVAVTALVVSLVALLVTVVQLTQQLFGTAEGYRRCGKSVLGPWHRFRERSWLWLEFRFETIFYTPHIELLPALEGVVRGKNARGDDLYPLSVELLHNDAEAPSASFPAWIMGPLRTVTPCLLPVRAKKPQKVLSRTMLESQQQRQHPNESSEAAVTWRRLLTAIHGAHTQAWPSRQALGQGEFSEQLASLPFVTIQRRTWDFMPDAVVRPLATATVGTIAILAQRLGMRWRVLDIPNGKLLADGNGYSLSSSQVDGLGLVLRFDAVEARTVQRQVIPSEASDRLICSILPGDKTLVKQSYQLVDPRRSTGERDYSYESLTSVIGRSINLDEVPSSTYNEMLILLCQFLPLRDCAATDISAYGFQAHGKSGLHWWESRFALMQKLKSRIATVDSTLADRLREVLDQFHRLEQYEGDFYLNAETALILKRKSAKHKQHYRPHERAQKLLLIELCRTVFDWTTAQLARWESSDDGNGNSTEKHSGGSSPEPTKYLDLVSAHARTSRGVNKTLRDWWKTDQAWDRRFLPPDDHAALMTKRLPLGKLGARASSRATCTRTRCGRTRRGVARSCCRGCGRRRGGATSGRGGASWRSSGRCGRGRGRRRRRATRSRWRGGR